MEEDSGSEGQGFWKKDSQEDAKAERNEVVGEWQYVARYDTSWDTKQSLERIAADNGVDIADVYMNLSLKEDGSCTLTNAEETFDGTYKIDGNELKLSFEEGGFDGQYEDENDTLILVDLEDDRFEYVFERGSHDFGSGKQASQEEAEAEEEEDPVVGKWQTASVITEDGDEVSLEQYTDDNGIDITTLQLNCNLKKDGSFISTTAANTLEGTYELKDYELWLYAEGYEDMYLEYDDENDRLFESLGGDILVYHRGSYNF